MTPRGPIQRLEVVDEIPSTQSALVDAVKESPDEWPDMSVLAANHQTEGRGRACRDSDTPHGSSVTASIVLRPDSIDPTRWSCTALMAGLAPVRAVRTVATLARGRLKSPQDVLAHGPAVDDVPAR